VSFALGVHPGHVGVNVVARPIRHVKIEFLARCLRQFFDGVSGLKGVGFAGPVQLDQEVGLDVMIV
jgi:hypothetical protein